jgi:hypothetical protein
MGVYVQALQLIRENKLVLGDLSTSPKIDLCIDGADEVTPELDCIKGGGGCHVQEKIVAYNSATFVVRRPQPRSIALPTSPVTPRRVATGLGNFHPPTLTRLALLGCMPQRWCAMPPSALNILARTGDEECQLRLFRWLPSQSL